MTHNIKNYSNITIDELGFKKEVPATKVAKFKVGKALKDAVK